MNHRAAFILLSAVALMALAGCGGGPQPPTAVPASPSPTEPNTSLLPARPVQLRLDSVDPCTLLTNTQRSPLGVNPGSSSGENFGGPLQGKVCVWTSRATAPDNEYSGAVILNHGAEYALGTEPMRSVDGFAATTTTSMGSDPNFYCGLLVDVAAGQALSATYDNPAKDAPGMTRALACDKAQQLATALLSTLRAQQNK
jgi:hypothetical protein